MKIIKPSVEIMTPMFGVDIQKHLELCGRVCYKSESSITEDSADAFLRNVISRGHESVIEHFNITVKFTVDRGVSHEIVRHRLASYSQESTRYCNYGHGKFGGELTSIRPCFWDDDSKSYKLWLIAMQKIENYYIGLLNRGATPQEARSVLPNSLKTELIMTANLREWRHFLKLRISPAAHPQIREVAIPLAHAMAEAMPAVFCDMEVH
jgi:thymidylate synthase (FAD)